MVGSNKLVLGVYMYSSISYPPTVREDLLGSVRKDCPIIWDYTTQTKMKSAYNTPNVWGIYILNLVLKWLQDNGGLEGGSCDCHVIRNYI